jgi:asparagine synthase (glutamine-hydrolysing)
MPGIVGIISRDRGLRWDSEVEEMVRAMKHEPFYRGGTHACPEMGVYCGWTMQENSFASGQVFLNKEGNVALVFSGECFLDSETRSILQHRGYTAEVNDGSWLIPLYLELGDRFFEQLNGLFSGLLIDQREEKAFLFNDRYGMERVYWHETEESFFFASEAKSLLRVIPELREFDWSGVEQLLNLGCTVGERTLFRGIRSLAGGSLFSFKNGHCEKRRYLLPEVWESQPALSDESFHREFEETFKQILPPYLDAKSSVGISLTAGLDSRMIMACLPTSSDEIVSYTFSGTNGQTLDDRLAARVAKACGVRHQLLRIGADFFTGFREIADKTVYVTDGCSGVLGAHEIYLNRQARSLAPVRVTGNFGSEILRGTSTFKGVGLSTKLLNRDGKTLTSTTHLIPSARHPVSFAAFCEIPFNLFGSVCASRSQIVFRTPYLDNRIVALAYRIPVQSRRLSDSALRLIRNGNPALGMIPTDMGLDASNYRLISTLRNILAKVTFKLDYFDNEGLPQSLSAFDPLLRSFRRVGIVGLHKYLHYRSWFNGELSEYVRDALNEVIARRSSLWNLDAVKQIACEYSRGRKNLSPEINAILTLDAVERLLLRPSSFCERKHCTAPSALSEVV